LVDQKGLTIFVDDKREVWDCRCMPNAKVAWYRPRTNERRQLVYTSKCGRFVIIKHKWVLPRSSTSYILQDCIGRGREHDCDTLAEAKEWAQDILDCEAADTQMEVK
jgi:hypothetical protein